MIGLRANPGHLMPRPLSTEGARRRRERAAEEARWEARLRAMARRQPEERAAPLAANAPPVTIQLELIDHMTRYDNLVMPRALPVTIGSDGENLACGKCGGVIAARASRETVRGLYPQGDRLVIRCLCRALNAICGVAGRRNRYCFRQTTPRARPPRP